MSCAGGDGRGTGRGSIDNLSPSFWLLAWLVFALALVCKFKVMFCKNRHIFFNCALDVSDDLSAKFASLLTVFINFLAIFGPFCCTKTCFGS